MTEHLFDRDLLVVTASEPVHVATLRRRFGHLANVETAVVDYYSDPPAPLFEVDTALVFDGLQRSPEPKVFLTNVAAPVESAGHALIQVSAHAGFYGPSDEAAGHARRFDRAELEDLVRACGLELVAIEEFNRFGALGWRGNHALGSGRITPGAAKAFDLLVSLAKRVEAVLPGRGLS